ARLGDVAGAHVGQRRRLQTVHLDSLVGQALDVDGQALVGGAHHRRNIVSVLAPLAGLALAIPLGLLVVWITDSHGAAMVKHSATFFAVALAVGLLSGCIALARSERLWGISIVGLAVNAAILALLVYWDP